MTASSDGGSLSDTDRLRLRRSIRRWFVPIAGVLLVLAAVGAGAVYATHVEPGETTEERVVASWSDRADFSHAATVQRDTAAFPVGAELRNRPVYYTHVAPDVEVEYGTGYTASDSGSLDVETTLELLWRSTDGDGNVLWQITEPVASEAWSDVEPGDTKRVSTTFNATEINDRIERIEAEIGSSRGSPETVLVARTTYAGSVNGESVSQRRVHTLPLDHRGTTYGFLEPDVETGSSQRTVSESAPVVYGAVRSVGSILLAVVPLSGLMVLGGARAKRVFELSPEEEAYLQHALAREEYDEWISPGRIPESVATQSAVEVASLQGIVNVAIDSGRRVIEDGDRYVLTTPELTYRFVNDAPPLPAADSDDDPSPVDADRETDHSPDGSTEESAADGDDLFGDLTGESTVDADANGKAAASVTGATRPDPMDDASGDQGDEPSEQ